MPTTYWIDRLARFGYVIKGLVYILIGALALRAAFDLVGGQITGLTGALKAILIQPFGQILLGVVVVGLGTYALWFIIRAVLDVENEGSGWLALVKRFSYGFNGVGHLGLALIGVQLLIGLKASSDEQAPESLASRLLAQPLGQWLVILVAAMIAGVAIYNLYDAYQAKFCEGLRLEEMEKGLITWAVLFGQIGRVAQSIILMVIALFSIRTALLFDPQQAQGLEGALAYLDQLAFGPWLFWASSFSLTWPRAILWLR
jgi:hypothetical protein